MPASPPVPSRRREPGESLVWLTALGLAVGLLLVVGLMGVVLWNGVQVFWPHEVALITYREGGAEKRIAGIIVKDRPKQVGAGTEIQVFTGGKDIYGLGFRYIDQADISARTRPADAVIIERLENGPIIGQALRLRLRDGTAVDAGQDGFQAALDLRIDEVTARRSAIEHLEKEVIGANSRAIERLTRQRTGQSGAEVLRTDAELARLRSAYAEMAGKARELRRQQGEEQFVLRLYSGEEKTLPLGQVVGYQRPNALGFFGKVGRFCANAWHFVSDDPREANTEGGIFPAIFGTFVMTLLMSVAVVPFGVLAAIYLREYARQGAFVRAVRIAVNNLAGVPSIVFGIFGLGFFVYLVGGSIDDLFFHDRLPSPTFGTGGILWASLTLALLTVPVVIVATEESIASVPRGAKEGSLALGASKWQTIRNVVLPASVPGILTGLILAMARGAGEVAPLMMVGVVKLAPSLAIDGHWNDTDVLPFVHLDQQFMHLGFHIYDLGFQSPDSDAAKPMVFATTLLLIGLVVALNLAAILIRERLRRRFSTPVF